MIAQQYLNNEDTGTVGDLGLTKDQLDLVRKISQVEPQAEPEPNVMGVPDDIDSPEMQGDPGMEHEPDMLDEQESPVVDDGEQENLSKVVFNFLAGLGYPPRRLHEFKEQFFDERGSKDGNTQVTVTIPDQVYGSDQPIPKPKMKELVDAIESKFGLSFVDYKRSNLKLVLNFSSVDPNAERLEEGPGDVLDQVYGKPKKGNSKGKSPTEAKSLQEMIKTSKSDYLENLMRIVGDNNGR